MLTLEFRRWLRAAFGQREARPRWRTRPRFRPALETFEARLAPAATGVVTTLASDDANTVGTLRYFIENTTVDTIVFRAGLTGTLTLTSAHGGELDITRNLTISGPGANKITVARSASDEPFRIFEIVSGTRASISGLTVTGGSAPEDLGGGILADSGSTLSLSSSVVTKNGSKFGGGIAAEGALTITGSTISNNTVTSQDRETGAAGGGVALATSFEGATATGSIINSTIANNQAVGGNGTVNSPSGVSATGGGIDVLGATLSITSSTIAFNTATGGRAAGRAAAGSGTGGGIESKFGTPSLQNTIVGKNVASTSGPDVSGTFTSLGHNLIGNTAGGSGFGHAGDILNRDPGLNQLANNGGTTPTCSLQANSPAIGHAQPLANVTTDQRGLRRKPAPDIGAFETQPVIVVPPVRIGRRWIR